MSWGSQGFSAELNHLGSETKKGAGLTATSTRFLADCIPACSSTQRSQPEATPIYRAELVALSGQGTQLEVLPGLDSQPAGHTGCGGHPGRGGNSQSHPTVELSVPSGKHGHKKCGPQPIMHPHRESR